MLSCTQPVIESMRIRERLDPRERDLPLLARHCEDARYVWNLGLEQRDLFWQRGRSQKIPCKNQMIGLAQARKETRGYSHR